MRSLGLTFIAKLIKKNVPDENPRRVIRITYQLA
jgi:hypothetical protein